MEFFTSSFIWKLAMLLCNLDDFCQPLRCVLTPHKEVGVCTSPKHHPTHLYSLLVETVHISRRQQCFSPWFTGVLCSQDLSGCLGLFLHCWLSTNHLPHQWSASHFLTAITNISITDYTQENEGIESLPSAGQQSQLLALVSPLSPCVTLQTPLVHTGEMGRAPTGAQKMEIWNAFVNTPAGRGGCHKVEGEVSKIRINELAGSSKGGHSHAGCSPWLSGNGTTSMSFLMPLKSLSEWVKQLPGNNNLFAINHLTQSQLCARTPGLFLLSDPELKRVSVPPSNLAMRKLLRYSQQCSWPPDFLQLGQDDWLGFREGEKQERSEATCGWWSVSSEQAEQGDLPLSSLNHVLTMFGGWFFF